MLQVTTSSPTETEALARDIAATLPHGAIVLLDGDLGAGKTVFSRALIRALADDQNLDVPSPTFNLVYGYETPGGPVAHFDLYRLQAASELEEIGFDDARSGRAVIVEWPDRLGSYVHHLRRAIAIHIQIDPTNPQRRKISIDMSKISTIPRTAFVFAAGLGNRMKPLTDRTPKPLIEVNGRPVLSYLLELLEQAGVSKLVMNTHHLPDQVERFADLYRDRFEIKISYEPELLETGGGLKRALPLIDDDVFYAVNGDSPLIDGAGLPSLARLAQAFNPSEMDIMLLLQPNNAQMITPWVGDYTMDSTGRLTRSLAKSGTHMFTGVRILHRRCLNDNRDGRYSFLENMDAAQVAGRLFGLEHNGEWHHLSTPQDVEIVEKYLQGRDPTKMAEGVG